MEAILRRERLIILGCLAVMALLAWIYLFHVRSAMPGMDMAGMDMPGMVMPGLEWNLTTVLLLYLMWAVMMVAMMIPSASPVVLAFAAVGAGEREPGLGAAIEVPRGRAAIPTRMIPGVQPARRKTACECDHHGNPAEG